MVRVLLAEDHHIVRHGLRALFETIDDVQVVGEAEDGQAAIQLVEQLAPDVLVMDIGMPRLNGIHVTTLVRSRHPETRIVILSMYSDETLVRQALRSGASGYVLKRSATEELLLAIRAASRGETYLSPAISQSIVGPFLAQPPADDKAHRFDQLTAREHQVLQLVVDGKTNSEIAQILQLSVKTIEKHRASLMTTLQVHDVATLVRTALKYGLILPND